MVNGLDAKTYNTRKLILTIALLLVISPLFVTYSSNGVQMQVWDENDQITNKDVNTHTPSANELTTWYHDGSNTTGWSTSYNEWTLNSSGTALYSQANSSTMPEHAVFTYPFDTPFVVGYDFKIEAQVQYTSTGMEDGGLNIMAMYGSSFVHRLAYTAAGSTRVSWALNHYTGQSDVYDYEYTMSYMSYSSMWYNSTDSTTRSNLGDGIVSTSENAYETRRISSLILDFWAQNGLTSPNIQIDWIKITGGLVPDIDSPDDIEMEYSDSELLLWTPQAYAPETYEFYIDDVLEDTQMWNGSQLGFPLTDLDPGYYKYQLYVYDEMDYVATDIVWVNVTDTTPPVISGVSDFSIVYGVPNEYLTWTCSESYPDYYIIAQDGIIIDENTWNGTTLEVNLNGLAIDSYLFEIFLNDTYGNSASDAVIISVVPDNPPTITPLDNVTIELGSMFSYLVWDCSDETPEFFIISKDGTEIDSGVWNGSSLEVNIDGLDLGVYLYTLFVNDTAGNSATSDVFVNITDTIDPIVAGPDDFSFEFGITGQSITWVVSDLSPDSMIILQNGISIISDDWSNGNIVLDLDSLSLGVGTYNFTIIVYDSSGNSASDTVIVTLSQPETTPTSSTTSTSTTTSTTSNTTSGVRQLDPMLLAIAGAAGVLILLIVVIVLMRKK